MNRDFGEPSVIFEDKELLVLNKPAGLVVNRSETVKVTTLQDWVENYLAKDKKFLAGLKADEEFAERSGMIHRLDKDTSGVIMFAKTPEVMRAYFAKFEGREVHKTYTALTHGNFVEPAGIISVPIRRHTERRDVYTVGEEGRPSVTEYKVLQEFAAPDEKKLGALIEKLGRTEEYNNLKKALRVYEGGFSLVELKPKTGRTHQLRVHLKFLQHPIVGDWKYTGGKRWWLDQLWNQRQWLHASQLEVEGKVFTAPLAEDLQDALVFLQKE